MQAVNGRVVKLKPVKLACEGVVFLRLIAASVAAQEPIPGIYMK
jgi:hypothetical protein